MSTNLTSHLQLLKFSTMSRRCPQCRHPLKGKFTWRGLLWAIFCFPCGFFCYYRRRKMRCSNCENEVIISDGSVPKLAKIYKDYCDSKWQFPANQTIRRN